VVVIQTFLDLCLRFGRWYNHLLTNVPINKLLNVISPCVVIAVKSGASSPILGIGVISADIISSLISYYDVNIQQNRYTIKLLFKTTSDLFDELPSLGFFGAFGYSESALNQLEADRFLAGYVPVAAC